MPGGAPEGNHNAAKGVRWRNAIETALANRCKSDGQKALVQIAEQLLEKAAEGDLTAIKELGDRIDGKSPQTNILAGDEDRPLTTKVIREIVDPKQASK